MNAPARIAVKSYHISCIKILQHYKKLFQASNKPIGRFEWDQVTHEDFKEFRFGDYMDNVTLQQAAQLAPSTGPSIKTKTPAELFSYSIKRDPTAYPTLQKDTMYDNWFGEFHAVGSLHGLDNLFDKEYVPYGREDEELLALQQKILNSVLCTKLVTSSGKALVRAHSSNRDAKAILVALEDYIYSSTKAGIDSGDLLTYITSAQLGPSSTWNGSTEDFILN